MATLDEIMAKATRVERTVNVCVAGKTAGEYDRVDAEFQSAIQATGGRLVSDNSVKALQERRDALSAELEDATYAFTFRALSPKEWSDLIAEHPDPSGQLMFNPDTFPVAAIGASCIDPEGLNDPDTLTLFMDNLSAAQSADLFDAAWSVNTDAPKGLTSSVA